MADHWKQQLYPSSLRNNNFVIFCQNFLSLPCVCVCVSCTDFLVDLYLVSITCLES